MKSRFRPFVISLIPCICLNQVSIADAKKYRDFTYEETDGAITITAYSPFAEGDVEVPAFIESIPVTTIGSYAFEDTELDSVSLPETVTTLKAFAFNDSSINKIFISSSVESIGDRAFGDVGWLQSIEVDAGNTDFASQDGVLFNKDLTELIKMPVWREEYDNYIIPKTVTRISNSAFENFVGLSVTLPASLISIGEDAFLNANLTSIDIPASTVEIGANSFESIRSLTSINVEVNNPSYSSSDGVWFEGSMETLLLYPESKEGEDYSIPEGVVRIAEAAFEDVIFLKNLSLPASLTEIGTEALAFFVSSFNVDESNTVLKSVEGVIFNELGTELLVYPRGNDAESYQVPDGTEKLVRLRFSEVLV